MSEKEMPKIPELILPRSMVFELTGTEGYTAWPEYIRYVPEATLSHLQAENEKYRKALEQIELEFTYPHPKHSERIFGLLTEALSSPAPKGESDGKKQHYPCPLHGGTECCCG